MRGGPAFVKGIRYVKRSVTTKENNFEILKNYMAPVCVNTYQQQNL